MSYYGLLITISLLMLFCVFASKMLSRLGVPILIFFIAVGVILGSDLVAGINYDNPFLTKEIGNIALMFIIFYGGMDFPWRSSKHIIPQGIALSTVGIFITAFGIGYIAHLVTGMGLIECILLGAIVAPTDAASVFSTLGSQKLKLRRNTATLLEFESGSNDPIAYMMMIALINIIKNPQYGAGDIAWLMFTEVAFGIIMGFAIGYLGVFVLSRVRLNIEGLYPVLGIAIVMFTYAFTMVINGNYFLAIYIAGLIIGNSSFFHKMRFIKYFENQSWIMQVLLFVTLGLQVNPAELIPIAGESLILAILLMFVVRPIAVIPIMALFKAPKNDSIFTAAVGFRGAASIVFAMYPLMAGINHANQIFNIVFFVALVSVTYQSFILKPLAKRLHLIKKGDHDFMLRRFNDYSDEIDDIQLLGVYVSYTSDAAGKTLRELKAPEGVSILAIRQKQRYEIPSGDTKIHRGDRLILTCLDPEALAVFCKEHGLES